MKGKAIHISTILKNKGFEAYFVGGYVRDMLMKRESADIDIATSAKPYEIIEIFAKANAKDLVRQFLLTPSATGSLDYNYMIHNAEEAIGHNSLKDLRNGKRQKRSKRI